MATALEKIAAREQAITAAADDLRMQIQTLTDQLRDLDTEAADLATARKVILALGEDDPPPTCELGTGVTVAGTAMFWTHTEPASAFRA
jgi:hypothetical protein